MYPVWFNLPLLSIRQRRTYKYIFLGGLLVLVFGKGYKYLPSLSELFQQYHSNLTKWGGARTVQCIANWPMNLSAMGRSQKTWGGYNDSNIWFEHTQIMLGLGSDDIDLMKWLCASPVGSVGYERFLPRFAAIKYIICNIVLCVLNLCKPGWNRRTRIKPPTCRKELTNFIT
jgi:hypothetical protein